MKVIYPNENEATLNLGRRFGKACAASCQKLVKQIAVAKEAIFADSCETLKTHEHLLRLALNEAEAVAWQTVYPHLIFPTLATEKVQSIIAWEARQKSVRRASPAFAVAK